MYKFTCASYGCSYIGETYNYVNTSIEKHIKKDKKSFVFKYLHSKTACFDSHNCLSVKIIDKANSKFDLKIKKTLPNLNAHKNYLALTLSL